MGLPTLQSPRCQQLTQAVWDLANENGRWPTFAELDRRLDSRHDIQAEDILREMPPGFLYGASPNSPIPPSDGREIALTIAGVAACRDTKEILSTFLEFTQIAAAKEKGWQPQPGAPTGETPTLTTAEFLTTSHHKWHLLQMVFLILKAEPNWGWTALSGPDALGRWTVAFDRRIRTFRGVKTIEDYWDRRYKPWETPRRQASPAGTGPARATNRKAVMVIYGHDHEANKALFTWLRAVGLQPQEWGQLIQLTGSSSPYIGQVLDQAFRNVQAVVALFTPDEHVRERITPSATSHIWRLQARPNVLIEAGMALVTHPDRTVLVTLGHQELPSDLAGRHYIRLNGTAGPLKDLADRLHQAGCDIDLTGKDWLDPTIFPKRDNIPATPLLDLATALRLDFE